MEDSWSRWPRPEWASLSDVSSAVDAVGRVATEQQRQEAYDLLLGRIGNNHAGTYFPIAVPVMECVPGILDGDNELARLCIMDVMIELLDSFRPEHGYEDWRCEESGEELVQVLRSSVRRLRPRLANAAISGGEEERGLANELLQLTR